MDPFNSPDKRWERSRIRQQKEVSGMIPMWRRQEKKSLYLTVNLRPWRLSQCTERGRTLEDSQPVHGSDKDANQGWISSVSVGQSSPAFSGGRTTMGLTSDKNKILYTWNPECKRHLSCQEWNLGVPQRRCSLSWKEETITPIWLADCSSLVESSAFVSWDTWSTAGSWYILKNPPPLSLVSARGKIRKSRIYGYQMKVELVGAKWDACVCLSVCMYGTGHPYRCIRFIRNSITWRMPYYDSRRAELGLEKELKR